MTLRPPPLRNGRSPALAAFRTNTQKSGSPTMARRTCSTISSAALRQRAATSSSMARKAEGVRARLHSSRWDARRYTISSEPTWRSGRRSRRIARRCSTLAAPISTPDHARARVFRWVILADVNRSERRRVAQWDVGCSQHRPSALTRITRQTDPLRSKSRGTSAWCPTSVAAVPCRQCLLTCWARAVAERLPRAARPRCGRSGLGARRRARWDWQSEPRDPARTPA